MGEVNKLLLPWKKGVIIEHLIKKLIASSIDELIVVLGHEATKVLPYVDGKQEKIKVVLNKDYKKGMTTSIQAGIANVHPQSRGYMICLCDQVLMETADYDFIINAWKNEFQENQDCIIVPTFENQRGNPIVFSAIYKKEILEHTKMNGCKGIVMNNKKMMRKIEMGNNHILVDIDTATTYQELLDKNDK